MKVMICWTHPSGYLRACLQRATDAGHEVHLIHLGEAHDTAFSSARSGVTEYQLQNFPRRKLLHLHDLIRPDALICAGWTVPAYLWLALRSRAVRIMTMDNQWHGTFRQWTGVVLGQTVLSRIFDAAWVPGSRQSRFARKMGFRADRVWTGLYAADMGLFSTSALQSTPDARTQFTFVGRLVAEKGIETLAEGYAKYRAARAEPLPLTVCGIGPLATLLEGQAGIKLVGFAQPSDLAAVLAKSRALVLPSTFEPWGVIIQEACAAGALVICSDQCGAADELVRDGANGRIISANDADALAGALAFVHDLGTMQLGTMSELSHRNGTARGPADWVQTLEGGVMNLQHV